MELLRRFSTKIGQRDPKVPATARREHARITNAWHAVSIVPPPEGCANAKNIAGQRFLSKEAPPRVPLAGCTADTCTCRYDHHEDRRVRRPARVATADRPAGSRGTGPKRRVEDTHSD